MTYRKFLEQAGGLMWQAHHFLEDTGYNDNHTANRVCIVDTDQEAVFIREWADKLLNMLSHYVTWTNYLRTPYKHAGKIRLLDNGQYALDDELLTSGVALEVLLNDAETKKEKWFYTTVEHNGKYYYFTCNGKKVKRGLFARMK